ncbi:MAG: ATP-binding cassette domain-containing protein, partial [Inquilinus sp.]|nr:ATP-binding cassette domain-containing protein [Inquilinus sp.]
MSAAPIIEAGGITRHYAVKRGLMKPAATLKAVDGVDFTLVPGKTLAVVGESGSGKSTLARVITMIEPPTGGALSIDGIDIVQATTADQKKHLRRTVQMVFQDPFGSLNPRKKVGSILEEPVIINTTQSKAERGKRAREMMAKVGLRPEHYDR